MKMLAEYRKAIVAVVGVLVLVAHRHLGFDLTGQEAAIVDLIVASLTAFGVFQVPNEGAA
jgi:hypothetical protein